MTEVEEMWKTLENVSTEAAVEIVRHQRRKKRQPG